MAGTDQSQATPQAPAVSGSASPVQPVPPVPQTPAPVILLAEDDSLLANMYKTKFTREGFQVLTAEDGEETLKIALEQKIDFMILDIMMPKLSGIDVLKKLRQDPRGAKLPVLVLSNLAQEKEAQEAIQLGAKEFLVKANLTPSQVVLKVKQYLGAT